MTPLIIITITILLMYRKESRPVVITILPITFPAHPSYRRTWRTSTSTFGRCWSMDSRFFPCPFLHKKILTAPAFARPTAAHRKKTSCAPPGGNAPSRRCCSRCIPHLSRYIVCTRRERGHRGVVGATIEGARVFFSFSFS